MCVYAYRQTDIYAHMLIVAAFLNVMFFNLFVIIRNPELGFARNFVEMNPTSSPELPKQLRDLRNSQKAKKRFQVYQQFGKC